MPRPDDTSTSMLERFSETECERETLGAFLEWLRERGIQLAVWRNDEHLHPAHRPSSELIAEFLDIDLDQLEKERRALLERLASGGADS